MLLQNLKDHAKTKHGSSHPKIKGQPTVSSMFQLGNKESRKRRGPDSGVGPRINDITEVYNVVLEVEELGEVDANQNKKQEEAEDQERMRIVDDIKNEFEKGILSQDTMNQLTNTTLGFEILFLLDERVKTIKIMNKTQLLEFVNILCTVEECMSSQEDTDITSKVKELIEMTAKELQCDRHNWGMELEKDEVQVIKKLLDKKPFLAVHLSKALVVFLSQTGELNIEQKSTKCVKLIN